MENMDINNQGYHNLVIGFRSGKLVAVINAIIQSIESVMKSFNKGKGDWRSMDLSMALYSIVCAI